MLAVCAVVLSAGTAGATTITDACADWEGTWVFTYVGAKTEMITITDICSKDTPSSPTPACMPGGAVKDAWMCVARGKKQSDNQTVQIRQISMDTTVYGYYEATDAEILAGGSGTPYDKISADSFLMCSFTTVAGEATDYGLQSGLKNNCTATTTTTTVSGPCPAQKVLGEDNPDLDNLRAFRDGPLAQSAVGRKITQIYYNNAYSINAALERSPALKAVTRKALEVIAPMMGKN